MMTSTMEHRGRWRALLALAAALVVAALFARAGWSKVAAHPGEVAAFARWDFPQWFRGLMGGVELVAAALLILPQTRCYGALLVIGTMGGAIHTYIRVGEDHKMWLPALLAAAGLGLALVSMPEWLRRRLKLRKR